MIRHSLATLNSNYFAIYGQKHKVWILDLLVILRSKLSRLREIFCFASKKHHVHQIVHVIIWNIPFW